MTKQVNIIKRVIGLICLGFIIYVGYTLCTEVLIEELEDFIHDMSPAVIEDGTYFELDDTILGTTMLLSAAYSAIRIIEGFFRKEDKKES